MLVALGMAFKRDRCLVDCRAKIAHQLRSFAVRNGEGLRTRRRMPFDHVNPIVGGVARCVGGKLFRERKTSGAGFSKNEQMLAGLRIECSPNFCDRTFLPENMRL